MSPSIVYTPAEVSTLGYDYLVQRRDNKESRLPFFVPSMDKVYPLFPGEMASVIARPGHGKTGVMMYWARERSRWLRENGHEKRVVIYATWEQSIEELNAFYIAAEQQVSVTKMAKAQLVDEEWEKVMNASAKRMSEPLWFIGHSVMRKSGRTPITVDSLTRALESVQQFGDGGFMVDCLFVDYLQRIQPEKQTDNPVVAYSQILDSLKDLALGFGLPVVVGVQANRDVEKLQLPIPEIQHGQWTSNVEQSSDRVLSLVRPRRYRREGEMFGQRRVEGHNQLLISVLKQKLGEANFADWVKFAPQYNRLDDKEVGVGDGV